MWKLLFQANHLLISDSSGSSCIMNYPIKKKPPDPRHIWDGRKRSLSERNKLLVQKQQQQPGRGDYTLCDVKKGSPECFRRHFLKSHVKRGMWFSLSQTENIAPVILIPPWSILIHEQFQYFWYMQTKSCYKTALSVFVCAEMSLLGVSLMHFVILKTQHTHT